MNRRHVARTLEEAAQNQFEDALAISELKNRVAESNKKYEFILKDLDKVKGDVSKILVILRNDNTTNTKGLVEQTRDNEIRLDTLEAYKKELNAKIGLIASIAGVATAFVMQYISNFINK